MKTIKELLLAAKAKGLLNPRLRFCGYTFKLAKNTSSNPNCVYVVDVTGTYMGKIKPDNTFAGFCRPDIATEINQLIKNPVEAAIQHGRKTGQCCCCGRTLFAGVSIAAMIGPICAANFGFDQLELAMRNDYVPTVKEINNSNLEL